MELIHAPWNRYNKTTLPRRDAMQMQNLQHPYILDIALK
jgi:hypothetical protein